MTHPWAQVPTPPQPPQSQQAPPTRPLPKQATTASTVTILLASLLGLSLFAAALLALSDLAHPPGPGRGLGLGLLSSGGGEDGPVRNYMAITGDHHRKIENDQFISTSQVDQRLIVKAVAVEELAGAMFTPRSCQPN